MYVHSESRVSRPQPSIEGSISAFRNLYKLSVPGPRFTLVFSRGDVGRRGSVDASEVADGGDAEEVCG